MDACRVAQLVNQGALADGHLLGVLLTAALDGLSHPALQEDPGRPAPGRLAFRELGLAIGISAIGRIAQELREAPDRLADRADLLARIEALSPYQPLGAAITSFWRDPLHREARAWLEHRDINDVMLATALVPEGLLVMQR